MLRPSELADDYSVHLSDGVVVGAAQVWTALEAAWRGDTDRLQDLERENPVLLDSRYDYTSPLHLAVLGGNLEAVRFLVARGAYDAGYRNHPFLEPLLALAQSRREDAVVAVLAAGPLTTSREDNGRVDHLPAEAQRRFEAAVDQENAMEVAAMLADNPQLAHWPHYFWGEGILSMPAKEGNFEIVDLLLEAGAQVPTVSKWGARYYFKRPEMARHLLKSGMDPNHQNWRGFTLLHDMAFTGDIEKARLLLDFGADMERTDDEYSSTPLGYAARWGHAEVVRLLKERGADLNGGARSWATPLAWAKARGHAEIVRDLH